MSNNSTVAMRRFHRREQSLGEEIANAVSHGVGGSRHPGAGGECRARRCIMRCPIGHPWERFPNRDLPASVAVACSRDRTLYKSTAHSQAQGGSGLQPRWCSQEHSHNESRARPKEFFRLLDHAAIYILIAGTYTPFALGVFKDAWGWTMLAVVEHRERFRQTA
jgi:hypothetical protein